MTDMQTAARDLAAVRPEDIDVFWDRIDAELAERPANPELTVAPLQTNDDASVFRVRMTSIDNYPIAAWFSVPRGDGPFPAVVATPGYGSVVVPAHVDLRRRYVTMTMMTRGQRGADMPYAAAYPGHLTEGIASPDSYVFRGVMADMLRAYEVLRDHPSVDGDRIAIAGSDMGLLLNARRPGAKAVQVTAPFWYRLFEMASVSEAYPLEEINDYLRTWPGDRDAVARTLSYFDPAHQASRVTARVQMFRDQDSSFASDTGWASLTAAVNSEITYYDVTHEGQTDHDAGDAWLANQLGVEAAPRIWSAEEIGPWR